MRSKTETMVRTLLPIIAGAGCMITLLTAMSAMSEWRNATPRVGDIVSFTAAKEQTADSGFHVVAQRTGQSGCVLDLDTLRRSVGSFVVESQIIEESGMFRVHWAGEHTATDSGNCGNNADLILDAHELRVLVTAAGGYDLGQERESLFVK